MLAVVLIPLCETRAPLSYSVFRFFSIKKMGTSSCLLLPQKYKKEEEFQHDDNQIALVMKKRRGRAIASAVGIPEREGMRLLLGPIGVGAV